MKEACGEAHLKVILETGELGTYDNVRRASLLAIAGGADFIKTSTGKIQPAATLPGHARHARGDPRRLRGDRPEDRHEARRRHPPREAGGAVPRPRERDARARVADARPLPLRRLLAPERRAHADPQGADRATTRAPTTSRSTDGRGREAPGPLARFPPPSSTRRRPSRATSSGSRTATGSSSAASGSSRARPSTTRASPRATRSRSPRSPTPAPEDVDLAVGAARDAFANGWSEPRAERAGEVPLPHRADPPGALARVRRARVARRRQADPRVARRRPAARGGALLLLRGLGRQARVRLPQPHAAAARRRRADHPLELPAAHALLEDRARARRREHGRAQAGRDDAADGAALRRRPPPGRAAGRASSTSSPATGAPAPSSSSTPDVDKVAFTGSTEVGKEIMRAVAGTGKKLTLELGGKAANIIFDDAPLDQAVEGIINGIYFNQGHVCCAGSRLFVQESVYEEVVAKLKRRMGTLRVGDPLDKNTDVGAINSRAAAREDPGARRERGGGGRRDLPAAVPAAGEGLVVPADGLHERRAELPDRAGGDLRAGALGAHLPHARRGGREGEQHAVRPVGRRLDGEGLAHPLDGAAAARRRRLGEHLQPLRPDLAVRRLQGVRLRPRGRAATGSRRTWSSTE